MAFRHIKKNEKKVQENKKIETPPSLFCFSPHLPANSAVVVNFYPKNKVKKINIQQTSAPVSGKKPPPSRCALSRYVRNKNEGG